MTLGRRRSVLFVGGESAREAGGRFSAIAQRMGLPYSTVVIGGEQVAAVEMSGVVAVVVVGEDRLEGLVRERLTGSSESPPVWKLPADGTGTAIDDLVAVLLGGRASPAIPPPPSPPPSPPRKAGTVKVGRETAGRKGKGVTTVWDLPLDEAGLKELAAVLKQRCGTGGTVKDGRIEIQGDQRDRVTAELEKLGYQVKRAGG
jgi:predicted translation initiation factor SUI1